MARPVRRNIAHLTQAEREAFAAALRQVDLQTYADGVSYWDKQDQIHESTHNHGGNSFVPWHRELCNRFERLLQLVNPDMALHYWDWTQDPRAADDGNGGTVNLCTDTAMGTANGMVAGTLAPLHNGGNAAGARPTFGGPFTLPPQAITRDCNAGAPGVAPDATILASSNAVAQAQQWTTFRTAVESSHDTAHVFFGAGNIFDPHAAFEDPFVFLLHSNVDRLFAMWQTTPGQEWRLDPNLVYGDQSATSNDEGILHNLQPWDGTVQFGAPIPPWTAGSSEIEVKNCRHPSVVAPPCYDTLPVTVTQVAPVPPEPIRFLDVATGEQTARAFRLRVRGCQPVTCHVAVGGDPAFTVFASTVTSPGPDAYETHDVLVWVLYVAGPAGSTASGTLDVTVDPLGDAFPGATFTVPIEANAIAKPTVAGSLVLDSSGSMDAPSGVGTLRRVDILRNAAPLHVHLLDDADGVGVVRFDTDATEAMPVQVAGAMIGGTGRSNALGVIGAHATNPVGLTAIGDGLQAAATQLAAVGGFDAEATVVFTDGHETAPLFISDVAHLIGSRVYAVGLGTAEQLNPAALNDLVDSTGGYLLLTGNTGPDDQLLLQKYFAQIIAGVTNTEIVVDPDGFVPVGRKVEVPYDLTEGDTRSDVIVLSPGARALTVTLVAPDGTDVDESNGALVVRTDDHQVLRLSLPTPAVAGPTAGRWIVRLTVDDRGLRRYLRELEERKDRRALDRIKVHGIAFTLTVQARSSVRMTASVSQTSRRPGGTATVAAVLTQAGIPLEHVATADLNVTAPDGATFTLSMAETAGGVFTADVATPTAGVYRLLARATGRTLRGEPFTREQLRTAAVWSRGDDRPDPGCCPPRRLVQA
jgi:hypothetical protein